MCCKTKQDIPANHRIKVNTHSTNRVASRDIMVLKSVLSEKGFKVVMVVNTAANTAVDGT